MLKPITKEQWRLPDFSTEIVGRCNYSQNSASVTHLSISQDIENAPHSGYVDEHDEILCEALGRYHVIYARESYLTVSWGITGYEFVEAADLQIFEKGTKKLVFSMNIATASGVAQKIAPPELLIGEKSFTHSQGPYMMRLRITQVAADTCIENSARRLYFDVLPIIVIGAGIAGIRAAEMLLKNNSKESVVILEAHDYVGGRARSELFAGESVDLGCQFLQDSNVNPLVDLASEFKPFHHDQVQFVRVFVEGVEEVVTETTTCWLEAEEAGTVWEEVPSADDMGGDEEQKSGEKQQQQDDVPALQRPVPSGNDSYRKTIGKVVTFNLANGDGNKVLNPELMKLATSLSAELDEGVEAEFFTKYEPEDLLDRDKEPDGTNKMLPAGMGGVITKYFEGLRQDYSKNLTIYTSHAVDFLEFRSGSAKVCTDEGEVVGCGVVLTVSTEVVNQKRIEFKPQLDESLRDHFKKIPMGHLKKFFLRAKQHSVVAVLFEALLDEEQLESSDVLQTDPFLITVINGISWKFLYRVRGGIIVGFIGGANAKSWDVRSDQEVKLEALTALRGAFVVKSETVKKAHKNLGKNKAPNDANSLSAKTLEKIAGILAKDEKYYQLSENDINESLIDDFRTSKWSEDPWVLGSYSYTSPGGGVEARRKLSEAVVSDLMVFGGEAMRRHTDEYATAHGAWLSGEAAAALLLKTIRPK